MTFAIIILELIVVAAMFPVPIPRDWADNFCLAMIGSAFGFSILGLAAWLLLSIPWWLLAQLDVWSSYPEWLTKPAEFFSRHPLFAVAFGPFLTLQIRLEELFD